MRLSTLTKIIKNPSTLIRIAIRRGWLTNVSDKEYLKWRFKTNFGNDLDLDNPKTFNEKLQWLKLYDRNPEYTKLVDKYEVRKYISETIGEKYLIPLYGVWESFEEINFDKLPTQFVLKATNDSGGIIICKDKSKLNKKLTKKKINKSLGNNYYYSDREWPYKDVKPKIIAEKYLDQIDDDELRDYRFFCFNGEPKFISVDFSITDKSKTRRNLYDLEWNLLPIKYSYPQELVKKIEKPNNLDEMILLSKKLSNGIPHLRVDFYSVQEKVLFGELTFYHQSGLGKIEPKEYDEIIGELLILPSEKKM